VILLSFGFGLGVLAVVLAGEWERKRSRVIGAHRKADVITVTYGSFHGAGYLLTPMDHTFNAKDS
jgi:hypothetical protein